MKKPNIILSHIIILFSIWGCTASINNSKPVMDRDYEVNVLIDTVLIFDPETGKEAIKIVETSDTIWLKKNEIKK